MSFLDKIEELQKKPESYRKRVLFVSMFILMSIVVIVWFLTLKSSLDAAKEWKKNNGDDYSPFKTLRRDLGEAALGIKDSFNGIINQFKDER